MDFQKYETCEEVVLEKINTLKEELRLTKQKLETVEFRLEHQERVDGETIVKLRERLKLLEEEFDKEVEKKLKQRHMGLLSQNTNLRRYSDKHIEDKKELKKLNQKLEKQIKDIEHKQRQVYLGISNSAEMYFLKNNISAENALAAILDLLPEELKSMYPINEIIKRDTKVE